MCIKELIIRGVKFLGDEGAVADFERFGLEVELLLAHVLGVEREYILAHYDEEVGSEAGDADLFFYYVERLKMGEPLAYIVGSKEFYGLDFFVDKRVLVPRPETEGLVDLALAYLRGDYAERRVPLNVLDLGTGSGNIAISIAKVLEEGFEEEILAEIEAVDFSNEALEVAALNLLQHGLDQRITLLQSDLLGFVDEGSRYDLIVANLPYIGRVRNRVIDENVLNYEPELALFGGNDGLELYRRLFNELGEKEIKWQHMVAEFCDGQRADLEKMLEEFFPGAWEIVADAFGRDRFFRIDNN